VDRYSAWHLRWALCVDLGLWADSWFGLYGQNTQNLSEEEKRKAREERFGACVGLVLVNVLTCGPGFWHT
jgi:hypothetical protein